MRPLGFLLSATILVSILVLGASCGSVRAFDDAGVDGAADSDDAGVDGAADAAIDAPSCEDRACNAAQADGCCPSHCSPGADRDCAAICGSGACSNGDGCCPTACNAINDTDCSPVCGNGVREGTESCDPLTSCPSTCPQQGCQLRALSGSGTCTAQCVGAGTQTACVGGDLCCPSGCTSATDSDCAAGCGNGVVESGETCDPIGTCPTSCAQQGCQLRALTNPGTCTAACVPAGNQTACVNGDGCCPTGCASATDSDCVAVCGNGVVEPGEMCDGNCNCPVTDPCYTTTGSAATCNLRCQQPVRTCGDLDTCCAYDGSGGCGASNDSSCAGQTWSFAQWRDVTYGVGNQCDVVRVGIHPQGWYVFTTCSPGGGGTGDPRVTQVVDNTGAFYQVANDDCWDAGALPQLAGWQCTNTQGVVRHFCASSTPGGFRPGPNATYLDITVCPFNDPGAGSAPFFIWYNAPTVPGIPIQPI